MSELQHQVDALNAADLQKQLMADLELLNALHSSMDKGEAFKHAYEAALKRATVMAEKYAASCSQAEP